MSLVRVVVEMRRRRVVLDSEAADFVPWIPENWITFQEEFTIQADLGLQENPGEVVVESATRRKLIVLVPPGNPKTNDPDTLTPVVILGETHTMSGPELLTDPRAAGLLSLSGDGSLPILTYYAEGEEYADVRKWAGAPVGAVVVA